MKGKIFAALAIAALAVSATTSVNAGCNPSKEFWLAFTDVGSQYINFNVGEEQDINGAVIGHVWQPGARATTGDTSGGGCPDNTWLIDENSATPAGGAANQATIFGSNGNDLGNGLCDTAACPAGALLVVIQTKMTDGSSASYTVGRVLEGSASPLFDFSRSASDWNMVAIPRPEVTSSSRTATDVTLGLAFNATDAAFHAASADSLLSKDTITAYQLVTSSAAADPGRDAASWTNAGTAVATFPLDAQSGKVVGSVTATCPAGTSIWVATRPVIDGFATDYVSAAVRVACSNLATPGTGNVKPITKKKSIDQGQK